MVGVIIWTDDLDRLTSFYRDTLEMPLHSVRPNFVAFEWGGMRFSIGTHADVEGPTREPHRIMINLGVSDIHKVYEKTGKPVIVVVRHFPEFEKIKRALKKMGKPNRFALLQKAGIPIQAGKIYVQVAGMTVRHAQDLITLTATRSFLPEPIRVAHLIAAGMVKGESSGRA